MASARQSATYVARAVLTLDASGLFDAEWYAKEYEVAPSGNLLVDFCNVGWPSGRRPNFHFDTQAYLAENAESLPPSGNPLLHYLLVGERENRRPSKHFAVGWYRQYYEVPDGHSCLAHYLAHRRTTPTNPNKQFDAAWYVNRYPEVASEGWDAFEHYARVGSSGGHAGSEQEDLISRSGLFDGDFYRTTYGIEGDDDPALIDHFCRTGWLQGCDPNRLFAIGRYLQRNPDVRSAGINPLLHYIRYGERENRYISDRFDAIQYRALHALDPSALCLADYLRRKADQTRLSHRLSTERQVAGEKQLSLDIPAVIQQSLLFDDNYYLINYPDVRRSGMKPLEHFCRYGSNEGRRPNAYFDTDWYRETYMSGLERSANPLLHYVLSGEESFNRPIVYFDTSWYVQRNGLSPCVSPLHHYLQHRRGQAVTPNRWFDVALYAKTFGKVVGPNRDLFAHYLRIGIGEDVSPSAAFDAGEYRRRCMSRVTTPYRSQPGAEIHEKIRRERLNPLVHFLNNRFQDQGKPNLGTTRAYEPEVLAD